MNTYVFFYLMAGSTDRIREIVPRHVEYWKRLDLPGYAGGPFADRSGGLIMFSAASDAEAERLASGDPFIVAGVIASRWLKQWMVEKPRGGAL